MRPFALVGSPYVIAHRGGPESATENSDKAFAHAVGLGVRVLESDVRTTSDGVPILHHDADLTRAAHFAARVADVTWDEIAQFDLPEGGRIMRLDDALTTWPGIRWNLDVKDDRSVVPTVSALLRAHALDRVCVSSFSHHRLLRLRAALGPEAATGATWREALAILRVPGGGRYLSWAWSHHQGVPAAVQVPPRAKGLPLLTRGSVAAAHELGLQVHAWVINNADEMTRLVGYGVDGIVTDVPSLALKVIAAARDEG